MPEKQSDRRVKRTRQLLADALISLMIEQGYDNVTIQQILDRSGVGRSTFYSHFRDKEALLRHSLDGLRNVLTDHWKSVLESESRQIGKLAFALQFFRHISDSHHLYRAFSRGESAVILDRQLRKMFAEMVRTDLASQFNS